VSTTLPPSPPAEPQLQELKSYLHLLERLERWLAVHRSRYLRGLFPGATAAELDALQAELGFPLPTGLRALLSWHNGQKEDLVGCFEESWNLMSAQAITEAKKELDSDTTGAVEKSGWQRGWIPFVDDDGGDYLCLDTGEAGVPVRALYFGSTELPVVAPSLAPWLGDFVSAVERGEYVEDLERGVFLRRGG
jgi:cell wall assembly regulator SMI1